MSAPDLFPPLEPNVSGFLRVDDLHEIYWEECGNPNGTPVLFLHGGPGAGCWPSSRRFFDPAAYRIILFDQRGSGRSRPLGETRANTTAHLIADIEQLRAARKIEKWQLFGGSWGATLALAYAEAHPERITAMVLRGIYFLRRWEREWFLHGMGQVFPDAYEKFLEFLPPEERAEPLKGYLPRLMSPDPAIHLPAATRWVWYEMFCSTLLPTPEALAPNPVRDLGMARLEAHYFEHGLFDPDDQLLRDVSKIRHIPAVLVQGRYDMVCPMRSAWALHNAWPEAEFILVPDAGHSVFDPGIRKALIQATEKFKSLR